MPLAFSPLSEDILLNPPRRLHPRHAFIMRQIGAPPAIDVTMSEKVSNALEARDFGTMDADASSGGPDYLERILGLIRSTGFTVAIFSHETRADAMANIALELGFAAMCGKPVIIVKSKAAKAPSDLTRTDWIEYDPADEARFDTKLGQALDTIEEAGAFEDLLLDTVLAAKSIDCAIALERANRAFLLTGAVDIIAKAEGIAELLKTVEEGNAIADIERLRGEVGMFITQCKATA